MLGHLRTHIFDEVVINVCLLWGPGVETGHKPTTSGTKVTVLGWPIVTMLASADPVRCFSHFCCVAATRGHVLHLLFHPVLLRMMQCPAFSAKPCTCARMVAIKEAAPRANYREKLRPE